MQQNKTGQIVLMIISSVVLIICVYLIIQQFTGTKSQTPAVATSEEKLKPFDTEIDTETLNKVKQLDDYGSPMPANLGM